MEKRPSAFTEEALCAEYEAVYRYVLSLCRNPGEAEDIAQDTFLRAMSTSHPFKGNSSLYTWLCAIAKKLWLNRSRRQKRECPLDFDPEQEAGNMETEQAVLQQEDSLILHRILHELPEPYKEVFSLRVFGELSYQQIAHLFGKTESWARVTYHRAKGMITERSGKEGITR